MKKLIFLLGVFLLSVASHAILFTTSCGIPVEVPADKFQNGQEAADYLQELDRFLCSTDQEAPEEP